MKIYYILSTLILCVHFMTSQTIYTQEELQEFKEQVANTKKLGRSTIILIAAKAISKDPESLIKDKDVFISVWHNDIQVKVQFIENSPIKYLPFSSEKVYSKMNVYVSVDTVSSINGSVISNKKERTSDFFKRKYLYRNTKEIENKIDTILQLNNSNDAYVINKSTHHGIIIREQESYYDMQIGLSYPITYKLDKQSGNIFDYEDPYKDFFPTPLQPELISPQIGGEWIEIKE